MAEESVADVLARYEEKGFTGQFSSRAGGLVHCHVCGADEPAEQVPLEALHRFEGATDPGDETVLVALECPNCGGQGTLVAGFGPGASAEDAGVVANLMDDRDSSAIEPGL